MGADKNKSAKTVAEDGAGFAKLRDQSNKADMTSSPALNDDSQTDSGGVGEQALPKSNRFAE